MNFVVMSVYWTMLHAEQMRIHSHDPGVGAGRVLHLKIVHSIPGICCCINSYHTKCKLKPGFWKLISAICFIYATFDYLFWRLTGRIQYSFIDFNKGWSAWNHIIAINVMASLAYCIFAMIDGMLKPDL